jgi:hypothetical protein
MLVGHPPSEMPSRPGARSSVAVLALTVFSVKDFAPRNLEACH